MRGRLLFLVLPFGIAAIWVSLRDSAWRDLRPVERTPDSPTPFHLGYDDVLNGRKPLTEAERVAIRATKEMPRTACKSVEIVYDEAAKHAHERTINLFTTASGFGFVRMWVVRNPRGIYAGAKEIDRAVLVSLFKEEQPAAYVLDEMATPPRARVARRHWGREPVRRQLAERAEACYGLLLDEMMRSQEQAEEKPLSPGRQADS